MKDRQSRQVWTEPKLLSSQHVQMTKKGKADMARVFRCRRDHEILRA